MIGSIRMGPKVVILGGGISGLSVGWLLRQSGWTPHVFERQPTCGGLARSFQWHGFNCDLGAHRLYTNNEAIQEILSSLVPVVRNVRKSQIYIAGKWIRDPVNPVELALKFFPNPGMSFVWDYVTRASRFGVLPDSFDSFTIANYGRSLTEFFFRPYTEKLFGISASEISIAWAIQKVRVSGLLDMIKRNSKTYFNHFYYPREGGYGAIAQKLYRDIQADVSLSTSIKKLHIEQGRIVGMTYQGEAGEQTESVDVVVSTIPITSLARLLGFPIQLQFQPVSLVYLLMNQPRVTANHWVYFAHKDVLMNRVSEFKNFSNYGLPQDTTVLCVEVTMPHSHDTVVERVIDDLGRVGHIQKENVLDSLVLHEEFGYPIYTREYEGQLALARGRLEQFPNLFFTGRNATFTHMDIDDNFESAMHLHDILIQKFPT